MYKLPGTYVCYFLGGECTVFQVSSKVWSVWCNASPMIHEPRWSRIADCSSVLSSTRRIRMLRRGEGQSLWWFPAQAGFFSANRWIRFYFIGYFNTSRCNRSWGKGGSLWGTDHEPSSGKDPTIRTSSRFTVGHLTLLFLETKELKRGTLQLHSRFCQGHEPSQTNLQWHSIGTSKSNFQVTSVSVRLQRQPTQASAQTCLMCQRPAATVSPFPWVLLCPLQRHKWCMRSVFETIGEKETSLKFGWVSIVKRSPAFSTYAPRTSTFNMECICKRNFLRVFGGDHDRLQARFFEIRPIWSLETLLDMAFPASSGARFLPSKMRQEYQVVGWTPVVPWTKLPCFKPLVPPSKRSRAFKSEVK